MNLRYKKVVVGGTFDLLHAGHKALINKAFEIGEQVVIGITTDKFSQNTFENQALRLKNLKAYLKNRNYLPAGRQVIMIWLDDIFGTTLSDLEIEAIIVSPETKKNAGIINKKRVKKGIQKLDIIIQPFIKDETDRIISSTRIRQGEISPEGKSYKKFLLKIAGKKLSEKIRAKLKKPFGNIISISSLRVQRDNLITVGDITTKNFLEAGITPKLAIFDNLVARQPFLSNLKPDIILANPPGQISRALILAIERVLTLDLPAGRQDSSHLILVNGEEDLAVLPAILLASLGTSVFYGQPQKGAVLVKVTLEIKDKLCRILSDSK